MRKKRLLRVEKHDEGRYHAFPFASKQSAYDTKSIHIALVFAYF